MNKEFLSKEIDSSFIKFCATLSSSIDMKDFLLNLDREIPKKFKMAELILFYESEQLGLRRAYIKKGLFYEPSAQERWPAVDKIRLSSTEENLYLAKEFGRPFLRVVMMPLGSERNSLLALEAPNKGSVRPLIDFLEDRKTVLELSFKKAHLNNRFSRTSYLWSQLFSYWREPLAILNDFQVFLKNNSFKKSFPLSVKSLKNKIHSGLLEQGGKTYQLNYYPLKDSLGVLYCQDKTKSFYLKEQLFQRNKMSLLSGLGQNMAHQLNNPLTGVKAMTQILKKDLALRNFSEELKELEKAVQRAQKIIKSFLSFSGESGQTQNCNLCQILEDTLLLLKKAMKGIHLKSNFSGQELEVKGDFSLLQQAFYNLILNACEALAEDKNNKSPELQISVSPISEYEICLKIEDNGLGIDPKKLDKIFQPFWTSKKRGTGLGLGVTKKIIQQFDGKIFVSSQRNQFTCFTLIFPISRPEESKAFLSEQSL